MKIRFEGHVQGVGFRFTTVRLARRFDVTGYVRNEADGSVVIVAEGDEQELNRFRRAILRSPLAGYIVRDTLTMGAGTGAYNSFGIEY